MNGVSPQIDLSAVLSRAAFNTTSNHSRGLSEPFISSTSSTNVMNGTNSNVTAAADAAKQQQHATFVTELNDHDVLMGRGSPSSEYSGNLAFRQLVIDRRQDYLRCTRRNQKHGIAMEIIQAVIDRGGRFLQRITTLEEAEKLGVPPRVQAWRVLAPSSSLCIKVRLVCMCMYVCVCVCVNI